MDKPENAYDYWGPGSARFTVADWKHEVANGDTRMGYWDWLHEKLMMDKAEGGRLNDDPLS